MLRTLSAWLEPIRTQLPANLTAEDSKALHLAITNEALGRLDAFLAGIRAYQSHPVARHEDPSVRVLWQKGNTKLLDYAPESKGPILFVVPSLVNRFEILDIDPGRSFLRFFAQQGFRPLVVDWQEPNEEERGFSVSDYMTERLAPILDEVHANGGSVHLLGYCMGGLLAMALALLRPAKIKSLTLMATPWDFAVAGVGGVPSAATPLGALFVKQAEAWDSVIQSIGYLPADFLQAVFTAFQPLQILQKFSRFAQPQQNEDFARRFVLTEDWLNNGVPLALPVARECLQDWFKNNLPAKRMWKVAGCLLDPSKITVPTYVLVAHKDRIVPPASSLPLMKVIRDATLHQPDMGHIGLMTGDAAPQKVWNPLIVWLKEREKNPH